MATSDAKTCECGGEASYSRHCAAWICGRCDAHVDLARCYCGWSKTSPGEGREELRDMGEQIDEEPF